MNFVKLCDTIVGFINKVEATQELALMTCVDKINHRFQRACQSPTLDYIKIGSLILRVCQNSMPRSGMSWCLSNDT